MDDKKIIRDAYSSVQASSELKETLASIPARTAQHRTNAGRHTWRSVAVCATALALLIGALLLPGPSDPQKENDLLFAIQVYAEDNAIDLNDVTGETVFAGSAGTQTYDSLGFPNDGKVRFYNTETGEWELLIKSEEEKMPQINFDIWMQDLLKDYDPWLRVYVNGEKVDFTDKELKNMRLYMAFVKDGRKGWNLSCSFDDQVTVTLEMLDAKTEKLLMWQVMEVTPVRYEKEVDNAQSGVASDGAELHLNEGYMVVVKEAYRIKAN